MFGRTRIVATGLLSIGALAVSSLALGAGTAQAAATHSAAAQSMSSVPSAAGAPAIRIPRPGQDDGQGGDFRAPQHVRTAAPSGTGAGQPAGGAVPGGAAAVPAPGPVSGLLAPVVGALHL